MTQEEKDIINDYSVNHFSIKSIATKYHRGQKFVITVLGNNHISHNKFKTLTPEEEKLLCKIYTNGATIAECCKEIHSSQDVVRRYLKNNGLYKTHKEAIQKLPQLQRKYPVKDNYFSNENPNMAYLMGFIAADGTIRKDTNEIKIGLSSVDEEFLAIFYNEIGGRPIRKYTNREGFEIADWTVTSQQIKKDLAKYNIVPNKTFTFSFPTNLKREYWIDFIRGYFDGDGCVSTAGAKAIRWQVCSATKNILETILNFFEEEYQIPKVTIQTQLRKKELYYIQYSSTATRRIYNILYPKNCLFLPRKRDKFKSLI